MDALATQIVNAWRTATGGGPSSTDMQAICARLYITVVDLDFDQSGSNEAEGILRSILASPPQARAAWLDVIAAASETASLQSGLTSGWLSNRLIGDGFVFGSLADYRDDIERLRSASQAGLRQIARYSTLLGDNGPLHLARELESALLGVCDESLLITGDPGSGKSGALAGLVESLSESHDVLFLSADALESQTLSGLRNEFGLRHDLTDVLAHWFSTSPGYVVIDALDAGRGSRAQDALLSLMEEVRDAAGRWRVIASIRRFDLRANPALRQLFRGEPPSRDPRYVLSEFAQIRHFVIPPASDAELALLTASSPRLEHQVSTAPASLRSLLRNFFCLRLFADLVASDELAGRPQIETRLDLLEAYWEWRVSSPPGLGDRRELALRSICESMMRSGRLSVDRLGDATSRDADAVASLLGAGVLVEGVSRAAGEGQLTFSHHVLFDFAVSRLLLRQRGPELIERDITTLFVVRPSFELHFEYLWSIDERRQRFWSTALDFANAQVPEIAKIIAPAVASELATRTSDLAGLTGALHGRRSEALVVLRHLIGAKMAGDSGTSIHPANAHVWAELAHDLAEAIDIDLAPMVRALLRELISAGQPSTVTSLAGAAARRLLEWCWSTQTRERFFLHLAIVGTASTFETDPPESERLLRRVIAPERLSEAGYVEMPSLASEVARLVQPAPALVRDIYVAAFEFEETSSEATTLSSGIVGMTSTRRQDYESAHYDLKQEFRSFLRAAPLEAIDALAAIGRKYALRYGNSPEILVVDWNSERVELLEDHYFWASEHAGDEEADLLTDFQTWIEEAFDDADVFSTVLTHLKGLVAPAAMWRAVLKQVPLHQNVVESVLPLFKAHAALRSVGLSQPIGEALEQGFALLSDFDRASVEEAIISLPLGQTDPERTWSEQKRDRLLMCLPPEALQLETSAALRDQILSTGVIPENRAPAIRVWDADEENEDDFWHLREQGLELTDPRSAALVALSEPVKSFASEHLNMTPSVEVARAGWQHVERLQAAITESHDSATPAELIDHLRLDTAAAVYAICRSDLPRSLDEDSKARLFDSVTAFAAIPSVGASRGLEAFDGDPYFSSTPAIYAAQSALCLHWHGVNEATSLATTRQLAFDASPEVRFVTARRIELLRKHDEPAMWSLLNEMWASEQSSTTLLELARVMRRLLWDDPERLLQRLFEGLERTRELGDRGIKARDGLTGMVAGIYIWKGSPSARSFVHERIEDPGSGFAALKSIQSRFRNGFAFGGPGGEAVRGRAFELAATLLLRVEGDLSARLLRFENLTGEDRDAEIASARELVQIIDRLGSDVYFASGAYERSNEDPEREPPPSADAYFASAIDFLRLLMATTQHPSITHHIVQTLDYLSPVDPAGIFIDLSEAIDRGRAGGYHFDSLAASFTVGFVSKYLAQHRSLFQTNADCRVALVQILDAFVVAGWPEATRLTYQLESVFR